MTVTREIKEYLHSSRFRRSVIRQALRFEVLSEAALRTAVANLLRRKIRSLGEPAKGYRIACEAHLAEGVIPDVLLWKDKHPRIWIELKFTRIFDPVKAAADWEKLQTHCKQYPSVRAGYLIYIARRNRGTFAIKRNNLTRRYWPIAIALSDHIKEFETWYVEYQRRAHYKPLAKVTPVPK